MGMVPNVHITFIFYDIESLPANQCKPTGWLFSNFPFIQFIASKSTQLFCVDMHADGHACTFSFTLFVFQEDFLVLLDS